MSTRKLRKHLKYIVPQVKLALIKEPGPKPVSVNYPEDLELFVEPLKYYAEEHFVCFFLNSRNEITNYQIVSHGTVSTSLVHPREVFKGAIIANAFSVIAAHNHPGGSLEPSYDDLETTKNLIAAGNIVGIELLDHVIVSSNGIKSIREENKELWH